MANPYASMINMFREEGKYFNVAAPGIGVISSLNPIQVNYADTVLNKENLKINKNINLQVGDDVFLYPNVDGQIYILLCVVI